MDVVSPDYRSKDLENTSLARIKDLSSAWASNPKASTGGLNVEEGNAAPIGRNFKIQSSWFRQFELCFTRAFTTLKRSKVATLGKVFGGIFFGLVLGALYSESGYNQKSIQDRTGLLFFLTINQTFGNMIGVLNSFTNEKVVVERERASNSYHVSSFYLAKFCAEIPFNMLGPIFTGTIVFWVAGLGGGGEIGRTAGAKRQQKYYTAFLHS
jgi:ATP-binding cassette subfamily G (WHITE) protein 2